MIRFSNQNKDEFSGAAAFRAKLTKSFPKFVAYCAILRACRHVPEVRLGRPIVVAIVLPDDADFDSFEGAAKYVAHGEHYLLGGQESTDVLARKSGNLYKKYDPDLHRALSSCRRLFLVAENADCVPDTFRLAADAVVEIGPSRPQHLIAAAKQCLGLSISLDQADFLVQFPMPVLTSVLRRGRAVSASIDMIKKSIKPRKGETRGPTLEELHGIGEAGEWGRELVTDLADWRAQLIPWADVDRGILVSGPPGTGKTTFAAALARSCGAHLVLGSLGRWQSKGHLGDLLKAMRAAFEEAKTKAPSILFLDEIDAVGDRERFSGHNQQYNMEVVAALLECLDGVEGREGVIVVGACNNPSRLDAALTRAGRLDRHVRITLPDEKGREGILRWHLFGTLEAADLTEIARRTEGWAGASLEQLVRGARRRARRARANMTIEHLIGELPQRTKIPQELRRRTAIHEAGHAIVAIHLKTGEIASVSVAVDLAPIRGLQDGGGVVLNELPMRERTKGQMQDDIAVRLAGTVAEEIILGERSAGVGGERGSDLHTATLIALGLEASYGLGDGLVYLSSEDEEELISTLRFDRVLQTRVDKILGEEFARARQIVEEFRSELLRLADVLLLKGTVTGDEVQEIIGVANFVAGRDLVDRFGHDGPASGLVRDIQGELPYVAPDLRKLLDKKQGRE